MMDVKNIYNMKTIRILIIALVFLMPGVMFAQDYKANVIKTEIQWTGKKVTGEHSGFIKLKDGVLTLKDDNIVGGNFTIDMTSITVTDLEDQGSSQKLVNHLKSDDFFGVEKFLTAKLEITAATPFKEFRSEVEGKITIKETTQTIKFDVMQARNAYVATITIDRAKFDVRHGSGSFFDNLGDKLIYNDFTLKVKLFLQ